MTRSGVFVLVYMPAGSMPVARGAAFQKASGENACSCGRADLPGRPIEAAMPASDTWRRSPAAGWTVSGPASSIRCMPGMA